MTASLSLEALLMVEEPFTEAQMIAMIDKAPYEELLRMWRFAPADDPFSRGAVGRHFEQVFSEARDRVGYERHVAASKAIGFQTP